MSEDATVDERAKRVVDGSETGIRIVDDVENGTASVDPDPEITGELKTKLT